MALDPASVDTGDAHLDTALCGPGAFDVTRHRWWTLRSESLELLPTSTWRIMATLTARGTTALVELRFKVEASDPDWLVLRGRGVADRRTFGIGNPPPLRNPRVRVDLELHARRVTRTSTEWQNRERPAALAGAEVEGTQASSASAVADHQTQRTFPELVVGCWCWRWRRPQAMLGSHDRPPRQADERGR
jgi:hypothetical protein